MTQYNKYSLNSTYSIQARIRPVELGLYDKILPSRESNNGEINFNIITRPSQREASVYWVKTLRFNLQIIFGYNLQIIVG